MVDWASVGHDDVSGSTEETGDHKYLSYMLSPDGGGRNYDELESDGGPVDVRLQSHFCDPPSDYDPVTCDDVSGPEAVEYRVWPVDDETDAFTSLYDPVPTTSSSDSVGSSISIGFAIPGTPFSLGTGIGFSRELYDVYVDESYRGGGLRWDIDIGGEYPTGKCDCESWDDVNSKQGARFAIQTSLEPDDLVELYHGARFEFDKTYSGHCATYLYTTDWTFDYMNFDVVSQ